jgi:hypothetical protein
MFHSIVYKPVTGFIQHYRWNWEEHIERMFSSQNCKMLAQKKMMPRKIFKKVQALWFHNIWSCSWFPFHPYYCIFIGQDTSIWSNWMYHPCLKNCFGIISLFAWYCSSCWKYCPSASKQISKLCSKFCDKHRSSPMICRIMFQILICKAFKEVCSLLCNCSVSTFPKVKATYIQFRKIWQSGPVLIIYLW